MKTLTTTIILLIAQMAFGATQVFDPQGNLVGATGVAVNGTLYDIVLVETTCAIEYSGCDEGTDFPFQSNQVIEASDAIADQVLVGLTSDQITGCFRTEHPRLSFCSLATPFLATPTIGFDAPRVDFLGNIGRDGGFLSPDFDFSQNSSRVLVVWTTSSGQISVDPVFDFGDVPVGGPRGEISLVIENIGSADLTIQGINVIPEGVGFGWATNPTPGPGPLFPFVIPPGAQDSRLNLRVFFDASIAGVGPASAVLQVLSDDPDTPVAQASMIGNGVVIDNLECDGLTATITGTDVGEALLGTRGDDVIVGRGGNDIINGRGGNDTICGGDGADLLFGKGGDDRLFGEAGDDTLVGGGGLDTLVGGPGNDVLQGKGGGDVLEGNDGDDRLIGGGGPDFLVGGDGEDVLIGNGGSDDFDGGPDLDICDVSSEDTRPIVDCEVGFQ